MQNGIISDLEGNLKSPHRRERETRKPDLCDAISKYQQEHGMPATGVIDEPLLKGTWFALKGRMKSLLIPR